LQLDLKSYHATENGRGLNHVPGVEKSCLVSNMMMAGNDSWLCFVRPWNERKIIPCPTSPYTRGVEYPAFCAILNVKVVSVVVRIAFSPQRDGGHTQRSAKQCFGPILRSRQSFRFIFTPALCATYYPLGHRRCVAYARRLP